MSSQHLPVQFAPFRLARQGQRLKGAIEIKGMARLTEALSDTEGAVGIELQFGIDEQGTFYARGHLSTQIQMTCQRCMKPVTLPIEADVALVFVSGDDQARNLAPDYDPYMVGNDAVTLAELVEDELILALPIVALHEDKTCEPILERLHTEADQSDQTQVKPNPFAVLSEWEGKK